jgi:hypothetical protein
MRMVKGRTRTVLDPIYQRSMIGLMIFRFKKCFRQSTNIHHTGENCFSDSLHAVEQWSYPRSLKPIIVDKAGGVEWRGRRLPKREEWTLSTRHYRTLGSDFVDKWGDIPWKIVSGHNRSLAT